jgi:hypothetical protein
MGERQRVSLKADVVAKSDELGIVWGYANVADLVDLHGEVVPAAELVRAKYEFMKNYALGNTALNINHDPDQELARTRAVIVESTIHVLGTRAAWYVGVMLLDEELRQLARTGELKGFSIEGSAMKEPD